MSVYTQIQYHCLQGKETASWSIKTYLYVCTSIQCDHMDKPVTMETWRMEREVWQDGRQLLQQQTCPSGHHVWSASQQNVNWCGRVEVTAACTSQHHLSPVGIVVPSWPACYMIGPCYNICHIRHIHCVQVQTSRPLSCTDITCHCISHPVFLQLCFHITIIE